MLVPLERPHSGIRFSTEKERKDAYFEFRKSPKGQQLEQTMRKAIERCKASIDKTKSDTYKVTKALDALREAYKNPEFKCAEQQHDIKLIEQTWDACDEMLDHMVI